MRTLRTLAAAALLCLLATPAMATVTSTTSSVSYTANGSQTAFTVTFKFFAAADLKVTKTVSGVSTVQTLTTHYTVALAGGAPNTGTVTFLVAPVNGATILIERFVTPTQSTAFRSQGSFSPAAHENALDRAAMAAQDLNRRVAVTETYGPRIDDLEGDVAGLTVGGSLTGTIYPSADRTYDLGTSTRRYANLYVETLHAPSDILDLVGALRLTGNLWVANGNGGNPTISFDNDATTGFYLQATHEMRFSTDGKLVQKWPSADSISLISPETNGASAVGLILDTNESFTTSGAKLLSVRNFGTEKLSLTKDGDLAASGAVTSASVTTTGAVVATSTLGNGGYSTGGLPTCNSTAISSGGYASGQVYDTTVKAWKYCDGTAWRQVASDQLEVWGAVATCTGSCTILAHNGISGVSRTAAGTYTVSLATSRPNANFACNATSNTAGLSAACDTFATGSVRVQCVSISSPGAPATDCAFSVDIRDNDF